MTLWQRMTNFSFLPDYAPYFINGIICTLLLSVVSVFVAIIPALCLALMRLSKSKILRGISGAYIQVFPPHDLTSSITEKILFSGILFHSTK